MTNLCGKINREKLLLGLKAQQASFQSATGVRQVPPASASPLKMSR